MFHVLNDHNGKFMAEETTFDNARAKAQDLADVHQQNYAVYELTHRATVLPTPRPKFGDNSELLPDDDGPR